MKNGKKILKTIRSQLKLSQNDLAQLLGVQINTVSRWESGWRAMSKESAFKVLKLCRQHGLTVTLEDLMS